MSYTDTFITVAEDCPVKKSEIPVTKAGKKPLHLIQYELLMNEPYRFNHESLIYEVYLRHKEIPAETIKKDSKKIWDELFSKGHPCLRASALTKRYGFGAHYNQDGNIAIYPVESQEYKKFIADNKTKKIPAMRSKRT